ncbi:hypothetical protein Tco_0991683 [Tanacetum coccineum]|uniref:Uncharacterized protein n=1 Tax=Tanacetum coccineum TaxID=301880 RepID=A0ABQ5F106_9ASTR
MHGGSISPIPEDYDAQPCPKTYDGRRDRGSLKVFSIGRKKQKLCNADMVSHVSTNPTPVNARVWYDKLPKESSIAKKYLITAIRKTNLQGKKNNKQSTSRIRWRIHPHQAKRRRSLTEDFMERYKAESPGRRSELRKCMRISSVLSTE